MVGESQHFENTLLHAVKDDSFFDSCPVCRRQDVALLDKLIREDVEAGKLPLLLIANAGEGKVTVQTLRFSLSFECRC